jgi:uncharacterized protein (TIGR00661 family)
MAVIFYSVAGEGMGHATRSEVVIKHLLKKEHKLVIFSYDRAFKYLYERFKDYKNVLDIIEIFGINLVYEKNEFKLKETIIKEYKKLRPMITNSIPLFTDKVLKYSPSVIITDFEPVAGVVAKLLEIPLICIDNQGFFTKCSIDEKFKNSIQVKFFDYMLIFSGNFNFILTVFDIPVKEDYKKNTYLISAIIRESIINANANKGEHILVYQTSTSNEKLFEVLKTSSQKYIIYGFNREIIDNNLIFKLPSVNEFANDLASCKGIITNGGFSLISEAVFLKKPIYSIPVKNQVEQEINSYYLQESGYGIQSEEINTIDLWRFINNLEEYRKNLMRLNLKINDFDLLDEKIKLIIETYEMPSRKKMLSKVKKIYNKGMKKVSKIIKNKEKINRFKNIAKKRFGKIKSKIRTIKSKF